MSDPIQRNRGGTERQDMSLPPSTPFNPYQAANNTAQQLAQTLFKPSPRASGYFGIPRGPGVTTQGGSVYAIFGNEMTVLPKTREVYFGVERYDQPSPPLIPFHRLSLEQIGKANNLMLSLNPHLLWSPATT